MSEDEAAWIGADPGGKGNFGIAILMQGGRIPTKSFDCADAAVAFVRSQLQRAPLGIGVDAPLWWSSGPAGERKADRWLRDKYGLSGGRVQTANSLRGAALVQAAMFIQRMREIYPNVPVTESHPKVLLGVLAQGKWGVFTARFALKCTAANENERDAIIAAVSAREGFENRWCHDLSINRFASEQDPRNYWLAPVHYFWPEE